VAPYTVDSSRSLRDLDVPELVAGMDAAGVAVLITDLSGTILVWNAGATALFGWSADQVVGTRRDDITPWGVGPSGVGALPADQPWSVEREVVTATGASIPVRLSATVLRGGDRVLSMAAPLDTFPGPEESHLRDRRVQAAAEHGVDLALICDPALVIDHAGPALAAVLGYGAGELTGRPGWSLVHPGDARAARASWRTALRAPGRHEPYDVRVLHRDGSWRWVEAEVSNLLDDPAVGGMVVQLRDVTDRHRALETLAAQHDHLRSVLGASHEGLWATDNDGRTLFVNETMAGFLGTTAAELRSKPLWDAFAEAAQRRLREVRAARQDGGTCRFELPYVGPAGEGRWMLVSAVPLRAADGTEVGSVGMSLDITERKLEENGRRRLALYDRLTGLPNRALLTARLEDLQERHQRGGPPLAVLFCDVDRFQLVNDNRGHETGDHLLVTVARRLEALCGEEDTVARFGDDEFVVVCPRTDSCAAQELADRICAAFAQPCEVGGAAITVGISIGVATTADAPPSELLQAADRALHRAKANGRGRVELHDPAMRCSTEGHLQLLADLRYAIDTDALDMHYQPIVHADGRVVGVEALLRWTHPRLGGVPPSDVIRLAEDNGLMPALGAWILHRSCADIAGMPEAADLHVAVNLSTIQLADRSIVSTVAAALAATGLPADRLMLEVTETSVIADPEVTAPRLQELKDLGVRLALDDFGTGYSSLVHLRRFPIDTIKIDRSFVADMIGNGEDRAIVASLANLAAWVGLDVVAEGVECPDQAELLWRLGCTRGQGYLWSPAVAITDLASLLVPGALRGAAQAPHRRALHVVPGTQSEDRQDAARMLALHRAGALPGTIAAVLNADGRRTPHGRRWQASSVVLVLAEAASTSAPLQAAGEPVTAGSVRVPPTALPLTALPPTALPPTGLSLNSSEGDPHAVANIAQSGHARRR
jgi:diguanylate cyclase (GGDEF)-like protein/PAS domain S-box-containing protein